METNNPKIIKPGLIVIGVVIALLIMAVAIAYPRLSELWKKPLGPQLALPTHTPSQPVPSSTVPPTASLNSFVTEMIESTSTEVIPPTETITPTSSPAPLCGGPPVMYILGIGADADDYLYGLADVMRIARIDFVTPKVTILTMPRDFWVEIPGISDHYDITSGKLNQSYLYGNPGLGYYDGPGAGPGLLARTLDLNFGMRVDQYGAVNMEAFKKIIDRLGGIDIYLEKDVDGHPQEDSDAEDMGYFYAGQHHFNGDQALRFARIRNKYNDFVRQDNQTLVLCAVKDKLLTPDILPHIPGIVADLQGEVLTDLSPQQITQLACLLPKLDRENLIFTSFPQELLTPGLVYSPQLKDYTFVLKVDNAEIRSYINQFMAGTWPDKPKQPSCP